MNEQLRTEKPKRIPYGMMNFGRLRRDNCYFVDKTRFIEQIEDANKYFFFIRPRRFGKSLTLSMLEHYYDISMKGRFDELFGDLYIGSHPTPERNQYLILDLNFASILADLENYKEVMDRYCYRVFRAFCDKYQAILPSCFAERVLQEHTAVDLLDCVCTECQTSGLPLYLFNIRFDYEKIRMFIRKDKEFSHDASVILQLVQQGFISGDIKSHFPAEQIGLSDNFISLLYYFGMITFGGTYMGETRFIIPNEVVREQLFSYLLATYHDNDLSYEEYEIRGKEKMMTYEGQFKPFFE